MNNYGLNFHHLGLAVKQHEKTVKFLNNFGYNVGDIIYDEKQNVNLIWCENLSQPNIEIIFPSHSKGPLDNYFRFKNELIYHICYTTHNLINSIELIKKSGNRIITVAPPKQAILFNNNKVSFYNIVGFGLIEILELKK